VTDPSVFEAPAARSADDTPPSSKPRKGLRSALEWAGIVVAALVAAFLVKSFLFQPFYIPSSSMEPTLDINDRVLINKLSYKLHDVNRGDIVVFERPPESFQGSAIKDLIKRVIALPGETVEGKDGAVWVNGKRQPETYLPKGSVTTDFAPVTLGKDKYFVMGDNRPVSNDSRVFGPIDEDLIEGRAFLRFWPLSALDFL
jgi:signal peptidase I